MSRVEVRGLEGRRPDVTGPVVDSDDLLGWDTTMLGFPCLLSHGFIHDRLFGISYIFTQEHANDTHYLHDFNQIKDALAEKYGQPTDDQTYWVNDLYQEDPSEWGMAVGAGHLSLFTTWELVGTSIVLALFGDNYEISLRIDYSSPELATEADAATRSQQLDDL